MVQFWRYYFYLNGNGKVWQNSRTTKMDTRWSTIKINLLSHQTIGSDFYENERYDAYHFIELAKVERIDIRVPPEERGMEIFSEKDIHYRKAIKMRTVISTMEVI